MSHVRIRPFFVVWMVVLAASLAVSSSRADSPESVPKSVPVPGERARLRDAIARERLQRQELSRRIHAAVESSNQVVSGLSAQAATMRDPNLRLALDRRIAQAKFELPIELLRVRANFARENGRLAQAQELEAEIAAATKPPISQSTAPSGTTSATPSNGGAR